MPSRSQMSPISSIDPLPNDCLFWPTCPFLLQMATPFSVSVITFYYHVSVAHQYVFSKMTGRGLKPSRRHAMRHFHVINYLLLYKLCIVINYEPNYIIIVHDARFKPLPQPQNRRPSHRHALKSAVNPDNGTPASNLDHRPLSRNCQTHSQKKVSLSPNRQKSDTSP